ncbi:MAG: protein kinase domain-containing protein [Pirellula sp.]
MFSSSTSSGAESKIQEWIDDKDKPLLERKDNTSKDVEICLKLLEHFEEVVITSFGLQPSSTQPPEPTYDVDSKNMETSMMDLSVEDATRIFDPHQERFSHPKWIGNGAFGVIFLVNDSQLQIPVALKLLRPSKSHSSDARERFLSEAERTARLHHPSIIRIYDTGKIGKLPYITSAYSELGSLANWLEPSKHKLELGPMSARQAAWFVSQIAEAIQYAHSRLTLHRDLKPGNILLFPSSNATSENLGFHPVVTDFGLSKRLESTTEKNLTQVGGILGTLRYMSPEQAIGITDQIRTTTDIYSLGVILYELLTNRLPFDGPDDEQVRQAVVHSAAIPPSAIHSGLSKDLDAIALKCLAKNPEDRYQTALELSADIKRYLQGDPVLARRSNWMRNVVRAAWKYPIASGLLALLVTVSSFSAISMYRAREHQKQLTDWALRNSARVGSAFGDYILEGTRLTPDHLLQVIEPEIRALEQQVSQNPGNNDLLRTLSVLHHYASICKTHRSENDAAIAARQRVIELQLQLLGREPKNQKLRFQLATSYFWIGIMNGGRSQNHSAALIHFQNAASLLDDILVLAPDNIDAADLRNAVYVHQGDALAALSEIELAKAAQQRAIRGSIELIDKVPSKPMLVTQAIYGLLSLANIDENEADLESSERSFQQASNLADLYFAPFWSEGWPVRECFHIFLPWTRFEIRYQRYEKALDVLDRWEAWYKACFEYTSVDGSPCLNSKESGMLTIFALRAFVNQKLNNMELVAIDNQRIRQLVLTMQDQQLDVDSLKSFLRTIDNDISLEPLQ